MVPHNRQTNDQTHDLREVLAISGRGHETLPELSVDTLDKSEYTDDSLLSMLASKMYTKCASYSISKTCDRQMYHDPLSRHVPCVRMVQLAAKMTDLVFLLGGIEDFLSL